MLTILNSSTYSIIGSLSKILNPTRSIIFYFILALWTILWTPSMVFLIYLIPIRLRHIFVKSWAVVAILLCRFICGVRWHLTGIENLTDDPCVVISNHQSAWETFFLQTLISPQTQVLKEELLRIPFFGWALAATRPIAINRNNVKSSLQQVCKQGKLSLTRNIQVLIFPEGTRTPTQNLGKFSRSAAALAKTADVGILPIAHNAGKCWPCTSWIKKPGTIEVRIGPVINTTGISSVEANNKAKKWIANSLEYMA